MNKTMKTNRSLSAGLAYSIEHCPIHIQEELFII